MDCFSIGRLSGTQGVVWQYTGIDVASAYTWAELHLTPKNPSPQWTSVLARRLAEELAGRGWRLEAVTTDNASEFRSRTPMQRWPHSTWSTSTSAPVGQRRTGAWSVSSRAQLPQAGVASAAVRALTGQAIKEILYGEGNRTRAEGVSSGDGSSGHAPSVSRTCRTRETKRGRRKLSRICSTWMRVREPSSHGSACSHRCYRCPNNQRDYAGQPWPDPTCGLVSTNNRSGDTFGCRIPTGVRLAWRCRPRGCHGNQSRMHDRQMGVFTLHARLKEILEERFRR